MSLSAHFTWTEATGSPTARARGIDNTLPPALRPNVERTAALMEAIRLLLGGPVRVTSWYRSPALNRTIGGSRTSAHMQGLAVDWQPATVPLDDAFEAVAASGLVFDQLIHEQTASGARWIHVGLSTGPPRREVLRAAGEVLGGVMHYRRVATG